MRVEKEVRTLQVDNLEVRNEEEKRTISGYAARFNSLSQDLGGFVEKIERGAFSNSLKSSIITALWNHNTDYVLGSSDDNLRVWEDENGLRFELEVGNNHFDEYVLDKIQRRHVKGVSFGFSVEEDDWDGEGEKPVRTLRKVSLFEISPTPFPAYTETSVNVRSLVEKMTANSTQESVLVEEQETQERSIALKKRKLKLMEVN